MLAPRELLKRAVGRGRVPSTPVVALVDQVAISALRFIHGDPWDEFLHLFDLRFMVGGVDEERWRTIVDHAAEVGARTALRLALRTASRFLPLPATVRRSAAHRGRLAERLLGTLADPVLGAVAPWRSSTVARRKILSAIVRGSA
jgi:hypothetical protein